MAYVIQVNFDSYYCLANPVEIFKFRGRVYKMLRGNKSEDGEIEVDCILSILDNYDSKECYKIHREIMIYLGSLSWEENASILTGGGGGYGNSKKMTIEEIGRVDVTRRVMPPVRHFLRITRIPYIYNRDQEDAIGLYREALVSHSPFYKFLCLWNILNIPLGKTDSVIKWINNTIVNKKNKIYPNEHIEILKTKNKNIGKYLQCECRNAIAHIQRRSQKYTNLDPNNPEDFGRISTVAHFLEDLVKIYIVDELKINKIQFLYRFKKTDIPEYLTEEEYLKK